VTYTIRLARPSEYAEVGELTVSTYVRDGLVPPGSSYDAVLRDAAGRAEKAELWLASDGSSILGTVTFCPAGSPYREIGRDGEGEFRMLAVGPQARGRGIGRALVRHCIDRSRALGYHAVVLCSSPRMTAAHQLYRGMGFTRRPDLDWSPVPSVTLMAFGLRLDADSAPE
jgi:ribosomal protein S18 acetylase RimI-like enzyme